MVKKLNNLRRNKFSVVLTLLIISVVANIFLFNEIRFRIYASDTALALATAQNWSNDYCAFSKRISDDEIESQLKRVPPLKNAVIEQYEGQKTLYVSYMEKRRFSQNWADSRYTIKQCN